MQRPVAHEPMVAPQQPASPLLAALLLSLGGAVGLGFGRFAYALLLLPMQRDLGWSYSESGLAGSANALGYLLGVLLLGPVLARLGAPNTVRAGMALTSLSLLASGLSESFSLLLALRLLAGLGAGLVYIGGAPLVVQLSPAVSVLPLAIYYTGPGIGMLLSGLALPPLIAQASWQLGWVAMGLASLLAFALMERPIRLAAQAAARGAAPRQSSRFVLADYQRIWPTALAFVLFGLGYLGYMTFSVAYLVESGVAPGLAQIFFIILASSTMLSGLFWGAIGGRLRPRTALFAILATLASGALLPVLAPAAWSFVASAVLFGGTFLAFIAAITRQVRAVIAAERWAAVVGNVTVLFASGQLVGPTLTGMIADLPGGLALGLGLAGGLLALAALVVGLGPEPKPE
jgi:predicted MFS family arabinose efflux permease